MPAPLLDRLRQHGALTDARPIAGGGSPASVWVVHFRDAEPLVVKHHRDHPGLVDGHDGVSFLAKVRQLRMIHNRAPSLARWVVPVRYSWAERDWAAYAMPRLAGFPLVLLTDVSVSAFEEALVAVLTRIGDDGYEIERQKAPRDWSRHAHLDRMARRLDLLATALPPDVLGADPVLVDGVKMLGLRGQLDRLGRLLDDVDVHRRISPPVLHFPVHGDLNLGNVMWDPLHRQGVLIDPRGTLQPWDVAYDLAKGLFTLTCHHDAMIAGFRAGQESARGWTAALSSASPARRRAAMRFADTLGRVPFIRRLLDDDPHLMTRVLFAHACHFIAEAACRLSDRNHRHPGASPRDVAPARMATGYLVLGLRLLDHFVERLESGETTEWLDHLGLLEGN
jgi:hypothetical protein